MQTLIVVSARTSPFDDRCLKVTSDTDTFKLTGCVLYFNQYIRNRDVSAVVIIAIKAA